MGTAAKEETDRLVQFDGPPLLKAPPLLPGVVSVIDLSSSGSDSEAETDKRPRAWDDDDGVGSKKRKSESRVMANLPPGFLDPLPASGEKAMRPLPLPLPEPAAPNFSVLNRGSRQFWKAGDFEGLPVVHESAKFSSGMDHVRVHPKFLHSNATSHKWALGAFAELLDNSLDEACNGATFVNIDVLKHKKDGSRMLLIEDNGGGMNPDKMRQCMSLGYSRKSQIANCIGQYGNGFKTSTMRLGADVIVFSCSCGEGNSPTKSIGMLSYTFLRSTGKEDIVVPMLDYEKRAHTWEKMTSSVIDWKMNVDIFVKWSPYSSEFELLQQTELEYYSLFDTTSELNLLDLIPDHGTRIVIYNLWEDDTGKMELDFDTDKHDIHLSGVNRDEKKIQMAKQFPNSKHFLTYRHSLRSYASILYLRLPSAFKMVLRSVEIEPHNIVNDMMLKQEVTYRPNHGIDKVPKDPNLVAVVTIGFVKDAKHHIDVQGFNVYHKNRLIKPFWRVWNAAGSDGRGVIGVLEANFVEPAHDKQGFERTTVLSRLESRLIQMQKTYWATNCHKVGYAPRCNRRRYAESEDNESSDEAPLYCHTKKRAFLSKISKETSKFQYQNKLAANIIKKDDTVSSTEVTKSRTAALSKENGTKSIEKLVKIKESYRLGAHGLPYERSASDSVSENICNNGDSSLSLIHDVSPARNASGKETNCSELLATSSCSLKNGDIGVDYTATRLQSKAASLMFKEVIPVPEVDQSKIKQLEDENDVLKLSLKTIQESMLFELQQERNRNNTLVGQLEQKEKKLEEANKEQEALIDIFSEERIRRDEEEATLRRRLKDAQDEISDLLEKLATCAKR